MVCVGLCVSVIVIVIVNECVRENRVHEFQLWNFLTEDTEEIAAGQVLSWLLAQGAHHDWTPVINPYIFFFFFSFPLFNFFSHLPFNSCCVQCYHVTSCPLFPPNIQKTRQSELRETSTRRPNN